MTPADVGTLVGAGSNGHPTPTETYSGGSINAATVIENKVITGAVSINADNVVFRNVHFRNGARTMISVARGVDGLRIEDSTIECTASPSESGSKQVLVGEARGRLAGEARRARRQRTTGHHRRDRAGWRPRPQHGGRAGNRRRGPGTRRPEPGAR